MATNGTATVGQAAPAANAVTSSLTADTLTGNGTSSTSSNGDLLFAPDAASSASVSASTATPSAVGSSQQQQQQQQNTVNHYNNKVPAVPITPVWTMHTDQLDTWIKSVPGLLSGTNVVLWNNIKKAMNAVKVIDTSTDGDDGTTVTTRPDHAASSSSGVKQEGAEPPRKRTKKEKQGPILLEDPFQIWLHVTANKNMNGDADDDDDRDLHADLKSARVLDKSKGQVWLPADAADIPDVLGGKLSQLCVGGLLNALSGVPGGLVTAINPSKVPGDTVPSADNLSGARLLLAAIQWHRSIQVQVRADILVTTPIRIQEMLARDLEPAEFISIRKRVYETVILGKGLNAGVADSELDNIPTAPAHAVHDIERFKKCSSCGNNDQSSFVLDRKNGDVICSSCGTVVSESLMHEGSQFRKFEGEVDRNHHGDAANPLYSNQHNMSTTLGGVGQVSGAGMGGWGSNRSKRNLETILRNAHAYTELNVSQFGKTDRRTRVGYKDKQKKEAFVQMAHVGDALSLHEAVVQRAKEVFAGFRDDRELVQQFKGVIAACLCEAFEQLSQQGRAILKQEQEEVEKVVADNTKTQQLSARAARRNELHHANMAGKGGLGLNLDLSSVKKEKTGVEAEASPKAEEKLAPTWDLEDCRSWLLEASRSIAQQWVEERNNDGPNAKKIPSGSSDELEGQLVEHSITLCEQLEAEIKTRKSSGSSGGRSSQSTSVSKRVVTPRIQDMSKLSIKWQKLGTPKASTDGGRTAGQILILKTAKKLGSILNDPVSGDAIHKELRGVVGRQEERKRKEIRDEASRQRFSQMKRKPWLQARAEMET
jgi:transcription initiation factor TFIIIB Brf1 subunit/transcription initiation factor TFIIB